ncbi:MAG: glycosyltransferase family 4 protein [Bacteroidales bacterium]|nr:glycosyltransferase family 4 protein [Bacteroidales bacterium]
MKILWITPWFGNYRVSVYDNLNKLSNKNFHLICSKNDTSDLVRSKLTSTLKNNLVIMDGEKKITLGDHSSDFANKGIVIKQQKGLYKAIKKINPDIIITEGFGGWAPIGIRYAVLHNKKLIIFYERTEYVERNSPYWRTLYRRIIGKFASAFIINGSLTRKYLEKLGFGKYPMVEGCMVADSDGLSSAVNLMKQEEKDLLRSTLSIHKKGLTFLFVGQLVERKGIKQLTEAWKEHICKFPFDTLLVIGDGILRNEIIESCKNTNGVHILGPIGYDSIHKYYAIADVFIMPTLEDNWSLVVPEAMACGLPVATTYYNGCYVELIKDGINGFVFDAHKQNDIVNTLSKFHNCDLEEMGKQSIEIAKDYTPEIAAQKIYELSKKIYSN